MEYKYQEETEWFASPGLKMKNNQNILRMQTDIPFVLIYETL
jgi:hypothetical protein